MQEVAKTDTLLKREYEAETARLEQTRQSSTLRTFTTVQDVDPTIGVIRPANLRLAQTGVASIGVPPFVGFAGEALMESSLRGNRFVFAGLLLIVGMILQLLIFDERPMSGVQRWLQGKRAAGRGHV